MSSLRDSSNIADDHEDRSKRTPRDVHLIHLILTSLGVPAYGNQTPLQLLTFAHRYIHQVLQDAQAYADHSRGPNSAITVDDVRLAAASIVSQSFQGPPSKELLLELAAERNKRPLPPINRSTGLRLPPEKYCLTQPNWVLIAKKSEQNRNDE